MEARATTRRPSAAVRAGPGDAPDEQARDDVERHRDHEQHEAEPDQRRRLEPGARLVERGRDLARRSSATSRRCVFGISGRLPITIVTAIVSPSARPRPRMIAPTMPGSGVRQDRLRDHLPAGRPEREHRLALRCSGRRVITSREIATIVGRIMSVRITPAVNSPTPYGGPAKIGIQPSAPMMPGSTVEARNGPRMNTPHRPIDDATGSPRAARRRTSSGIATRRGASSARKIAVRMPIGAARTIAMSDDRSVPTMNGSAP